MDEKLAEVQRMKNNLTLVTMSLLSLLFLVVHIADDIRIGLAPPGFSNITVIVIGVLWLYATLTLAGRKSGYIIVLVLSVLGTGIPLIHMSGPNGMVGPHLTKAGGIFFFVFTNLVIGVTCAYTALLAGRGLSSLRSGGLSRPGQSNL